MAKSYSLSSADGREEEDLVSFSYLGLKPAERFYVAAVDEYSVGALQSVCPRVYELLFEG